MNDKELFYLFLKHSDVVISSYETQTTSYNFNTKQPKDIFENTLSTSKQALAKQYSYDYNCYFEKNGIDEYGIFAYIPLYKQTIWDLDTIDKYKDQLVWLLLLECGDFVFQEEHLNKYEQYIPWADFSTGEKKYIPISDNFIKFESGKTLHNFKNIGKLSYEFIASHISVIDLYGFCSTGEFDVTKELIRLLLDNVEGDIICDYKQIVGYRGLTSNRRITIPVDVLLYIAKDLQLLNWKLLIPQLSLCDLTATNLRELYFFDKVCFEEFFQLDFEKRKFIVSLCTKDTELQQVIDADLLKKIWQGGSISSIMGENFTNLPYTYDFSIDLIKQYMSSWNEQSHEYFSGMQRTPDTNYHYYKRSTVWDILSKQPTLLLTYDLYKYLMSIDVIIGGMYILGDGRWIEDEIPNHHINALKLFRSREILDNDEFIKISNDKIIVDFLLTNATKGSRRSEIYTSNYSYTTGVVIDKLVMSFFSDFEFEKFKTLVTMHKNENKEIYE